MIQMMINTILMQSDFLIFLGIFPEIFDLFMCNVILFCTIFSDEYRFLIPLCTKELRSFGELRYDIVT